MNTDIRLLCSFKGHRKRKRLKSLLGDKYLDYLIDLWLTVAEDRPDGNLEGWDELDIALASGCDSNADAYADALIECGFLDIDHIGYRIHDWTEHQGWASKAKQRSEAARKAANKKWENRLNNSKKCGRNANAIRVHQKRNAPSPNPYPSPIQIKDSILSSKNGNIPYQKIQEAFNSICSDLPTFRDITDERRKAIKKRWETDSSTSNLEWWTERFFPLISESDFLTGRNGKWTACNIDWILNKKNFQKIREGTYNR